MASPSIGLVLPRSTTRPRGPSVDPVPFAQRVEDLGYESLWTTEGWGRDAFVELTNLASQTTTLEFGTSIVNVYSRTPAVLAMAAGTLASISGNRFTLGLGTGHPYSIEDIHGMEWTRPVQRTRETLELLNRYLGTTDGFPYGGEIFQISGGGDPLDIDVPVANAALGEINRRTTGELADGWIPYNIPLPALEHAFETISDAAKDAGRSPNDITVTPWIPTAVSHDLAEATDLLRENVISYVGGFSDDAYKNAVAQLFPDEAEAIAEAERAGDHEAARDAVSYEMVEAIGIAGTPDTAIDQLNAILDNPVIDTPLISVPTAAPDDVTELSIETLAPASL